MAPNRRSTPSVRRTLSVEDQLIGKLGKDGYGRLRDELMKTARPRRRGPKRRP